MFSNDGLAHTLPRKPLVRTVYVIKANHRVIVNSISLIGTGHVGLIPSAHRYRMASTYRPLAQPSSPCRVDSQCENMPHRVCKHVQDVQQLVTLHVCAIYSLMHFLEGDACTLRYVRLKTVQNVKLCGFRYNCKKMITANLFILPFLAYGMGLTVSVVVFDQGSKNITIFQSQLNVSIDNPFFRQPILHVWI